MIHRSPTYVRNLKLSSADNLPRISPSLCDCDTGKSPPRYFWYPLQHSCHRGSGAILYRFFVQLP